ncbi:phosphotransferase family protein [Microlunatus parietis]|uniref:Aminoglycoside phosphotransferase (APT) family kinase protein n=1 Tax=Microlunatus parietis TaxID=682979 RepID=A0A7Y9I9D5_9ACTN|nr:aminoglycoside phosphotransferase family protein [Microlunatus parietis]NYE72612.1 aminoglycoside phosphotransferase (APT) family kinase protein [Microlunatus parietis]
MAPSEFLVDLHRRFATPRVAVTDFVRRTTGAEALELDRIARGYDNEVYRVTLATGACVFVRIRRREDGFTNELWAMDQARDHGIPVPEVLGVDTISGDQREQSAMVITPAPGHQFLQVAEELPDNERRATLADLGRVVTRLHEVRTPGIWRPDDEGRWPDPSELREGYVQERRAEHDRLVTAGLSAAEIEATFAALEASPEPPAAGFVLCHGDLSPEHVFVEDGRVSCLIDWGMWHGGSRLGELTYLYNTFEDEDFAAILAGYGRPLDDELRRDLATVTLSQRIGHVAHHVAIGDRAATERNVSLMRRALRELRTLGPAS